MNNKLRELAGRASAATGRDDNLAADILQTVGGPLWDALYKEAQLPCGAPHDVAVDWARQLAAARYPFLTSLDAAHLLVPCDYDWAVFRTNGGLTIHAWCGSRDEVFGETEAGALTAACLYARLS